MAALALLAICAVFGVFFLTMFNLGQESAARDSMAEKALQAARAGADYGAYQSLINGTCAPSTLSLPGLSDFTVALACSRTSVVEAGTTIKIDSWTSTACSSAACPGTPSGSYVERQVKIDIAM